MRYASGEDEQVPHCVIEALTFVAHVKENTAGIKQPARHEPRDIADPLWVASGRRGTPQGAGLGVKVE